MFPLKATRSDGSVDRTRQDTIVSLRSHRVADDFSRRRAELASTPDTAHDSGEVALQKLLDVAGDCPVYSREELVSLSEALQHSTDADTLRRTLRRLYQIVIRVQQTPVGDILYLGLHRYVIQVGTAHIQDIGIFALCGGIVAQLAYSDTQIIEELHNAGILPFLATLGQAQSDTIRQFYCYAVGNILAGSEIVSKALIENYQINKVLESYVTPTCSPEILNLVCWVTFNITRSSRCAFSQQRIQPRNLPQELRLEIYHFLRNILLSLTSTRAGIAKAVTTKRTIIQAFDVLVIDDGVASEFSRDEAVLQVISSIILSLDKTLCVPAIRVIGDSALQQNREVIKCLLNARMHAALAHICGLDAVSSVDITRSRTAAWALSNLASTMDSFPYFMSADIIGPILRKCQLNVPQHIREETLWIIVNLIYYAGTTETVNFVEAYDLIHLFAPALSITDERLRQFVLQAYSFIFKAGAEYYLSPEAPQYKRWIDSFVLGGGVGHLRSIIASQQQSPQAVTAREAARGILRLIGREEEETTPQEQSMQLVDFA